MPQAKRKMKSKPLVRRKPAPQRSKTALMRIPAPSAQPWNLTLDEVALVRNHIAKGASDTELQFCLAVARRYKLDPFRQQIWFVQRRDKTAEGGKRWIPITGINGLLHIAARDHKDFGSNDEPEFGPMKEVRWTYFEKSGKLQAPEWARVRLWKKGHDHPIVATVYWDEIYPDVGASPLVKQMPRLMLGKCALAQAIRRAYPATDGLYIKEEFQGPPEFTPSGRVMTFEPQLAPAEQNWQQREQEGISKLTPSQQEVVKAKMADTTIQRPTDCLFYVEVPESGTFTIDGAQAIKTAHRDLLRPLWSATAGALVATPEQLGKLISQLEKLKVKIIPWPPSREPGE